MEVDSDDWVRASEFCADRAALFVCKLSKGNSWG